MKLSFIPSPDVTVVLNALLDILERRTRHIIPQQNGSRSTSYSQGIPEVQWRGVDPSGNKDHATRSIKVSLNELRLPAYFSQIDPQPRLIANTQLAQLEQIGLLSLTWLPGETGHLLQSVTLKTEQIIPQQSGSRSIPEVQRRGVDATRNTSYATLYTLLNREPASTTRSRLETILLADQFRFSRNDWRARAIQRTLTQLRAGKSPAPFSLTDSTWNLDLLAVLSALSPLEVETPYRVFSVRTFNDSKRFDDLKSAIVRLARLANPEWKAFTAEDILRELNLVANPNYIHMAGNWQLTSQSGEILSLGGFTPSIGFPAAQVETIQAVSIHAGSVLCIENLTSFHEYLRANATRNIPSRSEAERTHHATLCLMGNPSPPIRHLLRLIPETTPIYLWSDMDYGGFNILSQLRKQVRAQIQPYLMDTSTFEAYALLSHPLTQMDVRNLGHLCARPELSDVKSTIEHLLHRGLKLEQEAVKARNHSL